MLDQVVYDVINKLKNDPKRLRHIFGVYQMSVHLAEIHHLKIEKVKLASIFHDYCRIDTIDEQKKYLTKDEINEYLKTTVVYHAYAAANILANKYKIVDEDILNAIKNHVFGKKEMSDYEKVLFISDFCEITRPFYYREETVKLAEKDLNKAVLFIYEKTILYLKSKNITPSITQLEAYEYYKGNE